MGGLRHDKLTFHLGRADEQANRSSYRRLLSEELELEFPRDVSSNDTWQAFSYFTLDGVCVANVDAAILPLVLDGVETATMGLRAIAVDKAWRGLGLFKDLMTKTLAWGEDRSSFALLFTEEPELYERFGFGSVAQDAFIGPTPHPAVPSTPTRRLDAKDLGDRSVLRSAIAQRTPISLRCALQIDPDQMLANLATNDSYKIDVIDERGTIVVYEINEETLVLVDLVTREVPELATIVGAVGHSSHRLKVLFPPDRLGWRGSPLATDTGLMIRGELPAPLRQPFMIPPTAEF